MKRCSVVTQAKRKLLLRLGQNGMWSGPQAANSCGADDEPPAYGRDLTHSGTSAERGNPVVFPASHTTEEGKAARKSDPRDSGSRIGEQANAAR